MTMIYNRTISHLLKLFVLPEIKKRVKEGLIPANALPLELHQFRAIQKKNSEDKIENILELNNEVKIVAKIKPKEGRQLSPGQQVTLNDIEPDQCYVFPPKYDDKSAAYFLCLSLFVDYYLCFDLEPNAPDFKEEQTEQHKSPFPIADFVNARYIRDTIKPLDKIRILTDNNWPPAPGYYPNVLIEMHKNPNTVTNPDFINTVASSYNREYWDKRLSFWKETMFFKDRIPYLERVVRAHFDQDYLASIYILVPQFEGIITDYLIECNIKKFGDFPEKVSKLHDLVMSRKVIMFPRDVLEAIFSYLTDGSFLRHTSQIGDPARAVNRHGIAHGVFKGFECEEISLKYLVLLDSLSYVLLHDRMLTQSI